EGREPDLRRGLPQGLRDDAERIQVRGLALVGRHAGRGVAFHVLDGAKTLAQREREVLGGDVVLPVDERTAARVRRAWQRADEAGGCTRRRLRSGAAAATARVTARARRVERLAGSGRARTGAVLQHLLQRE